MDSTSSDCLMFPENILQPSLSGASHVALGPRSAQAHGDPVHDRRGGAVRGRGGAADDARNVPAYLAAQPGPHRAVVESTATWYWLRDLHVALGVDLKPGHSKYIKVISYAKVKTDAVDAHTLASCSGTTSSPSARASAHAPDRAPQEDRAGSAAAAGAHAGRAAALVHPWHRHESHDALRLQAVERTQHDSLTHE